MSTPDPEIPSGNETATDEELRALLDKGAHFLMRKGVYNSGGSQVTEEHNGYPVADAQAFYAIDVSLEELESLAPESAKTLDAEAKVNLSYYVPTYERMPRGLVFQGPILSLLIEKAEGSPLVAISYMVAIHRDGEVTGEKIPEPKHVGEKRKVDFSEMSTKEGAKKFSDFLGGQILAGQVGLLDISKQELNAFNSIFDALEHR